jgi:MYXO-CTERM domain-containing protein
VLEAGQPSPALILAYAVDPNGLSFADAVAAIQAIPEPSTTMLGALALAGGLMRRRRRDECAV